MLFMNEYEINAAVDRFSHHPVLSKATKFLAKFRDEVNANSDGWPYWSRPVVSAKKLMTIIMHPEQATEQSLKAAITPIKAFYTRHGARSGPNPGRDREFESAFLQERVSELSVPGRRSGAT